MWKLLWKLTTGRGWKSFAVNPEKIQDCCESDIWGDTGRMGQTTRHSSGSLSHPRVSPSDGGNLTEI